MGRIIFIASDFIKGGDLFIVEDSNRKIVGCICEQQLQSNISLATRIIMNGTDRGSEAMEAFFLGIKEDRLGQSCTAGINLLSGIHLEERNHGEPTSINIEKNPIKMNLSMPQAWLIDGDWRYNLKAMKEESRTCNKKLPTTSDWLSFINSLSGTIEEKHQYIMGSDFMESLTLEKYHQDIRLSRWWTRNGDIVFLRKDYLHPGTYQDYNGVFPIRFLA